MGFAFWILVAGACVGLIALFAGWRGRRTGAALTCRRCGYEVEGLSGACPECNASLGARGATRIGTRRPIAWLAWGGAAAILLCGGVLLEATLGSWGVREFASRLPTWALIRALPSDDPVVLRAVEQELSIRRSAGTLTKDQEARLARAALAQWRSGKGAWSTEMGMCVARGFDAKAISAQEAATFLLESWTISATPWPAIEAGSLRVGLRVAPTATQDLSTTRLGQVPMIVEVLSAQFGDTPLALPPAPADQRRVFGWQGRVRPNDRIVRNEVFDVPPEDREQPLALVIRLSADESIRRTYSGAAAGAPTTTTHFSLIPLPVDPQPGELIASREFTITLATKTVATSPALLVPAPQDGNDTNRTPQPSVQLWQVGTSAIGVRIGDRGFVPPYTIVGRVRFRDGDREWGSYRICMPDFGWGDFQEYTQRLPEGPMPTTVTVTIEPAWTLRNQFPLDSKTYPGLENVLLCAVKSGVPSPVWTRPIVMDNVTVEAVRQTSGLVNFPVPGLPPGTVQVPIDRWPHISFPTEHQRRCDP